MSISMRIRVRVGGQTRVETFIHHSLEGQASNICDEALQPCGLARRGVAVEAMEEYLCVECPLLVMCSPCNPKDRTNRVTHDSVREALTWVLVSGLYHVALILWGLREEVRECLIHHLVSHDILRQLDDDLRTFSYGR